MRADVLGVLITNRLPYYSRRVVTNSAGTIDVFADSYNVEGWLNRHGEYPLVGVQMNRDGEHVVMSISPQQARDLATALMYYAEGLYLKDVR